MARFVIDLGDIDMGEKAQAALSNDLQKTAMAHLAGIRVDGPVAVLFPRDLWEGLIAHQSFEGLRDHKQMLDRMMAQTKAAM